MDRVLIFNPGSASLKFELIEAERGQPTAAAGRKLLGGSIEKIGKDAELLIFGAAGETVRTEPVRVSNMAEGTGAALGWLRGQKVGGGGNPLEGLTLAGVRVVHGGGRYTRAVRVDAEVRRAIEELEELAPLHNQSSIAILDALQSELDDVPRYVTFDTAFHATLPEVAWRYPIERAVADRHGVRKFGFHGLSHRYMLEGYAAAVGKPRKDCSIVTMHLESGASVCAIRRGVSVDTSMGFTPLEGLMMGSRSGSIDPAIVPYLMRKEGVDADAVMTILNKKSGLLGIAGGTLDTRELVKREDEAARLAMEMFSYRLRQWVGAYLAVLGEEAEAIVFGGGIGVNTPSVRAAVCEGLRGWGLAVDPELNARSTSGQVRLSREASRVGAWVIPVEEGLQLAHECLLASGECGQPALSW